MAIVVRQLRHTRVRSARGIERCASRHLAWALFGLLGLHAAGSAQGMKTMPVHALDIGPFVAEVDADKDGCMTYHEWVEVAGAPKRSFEMFKDARGCVTYARMDDEAPPEGIDTNGDGRLTVTELKAFDQKMSGH
jgi:hypothetical protein